MIKSRFGFRVYLILFGCAVFLSFPAYLLIHPDTLFKDRHGNASSPYPLGLFLLFLSLLLLFIYARILYTIKIKSQTIVARSLFKQKRIELSDINSINLFSKEDFYWTAGLATIATRIELNNSDKIIIADPFYRNINLIKQVLNENFKEKIQLPLFEKQISSIQTDLESDFEKFAGNPHTSFNGIMLYGISIMFLVLLLKGPSLKPALLAILFPISIFYFGFGMQLNYFLVSNKRLIVKNHFLFWVNRTYNIEDVVVVDFETPYRRSNALRITTKDFKSNLFCAGSLRDKTWIELREKLKGLKINFVE